MDKKEFSQIRRKLGKTQTQMAQLLGTSPKAIQSFEQGWRRVPVHIERQVLFLIALKYSRKKNSRTVMGHKALFAMTEPWTLQSHGSFLPKRIE